MKINKFRFLVNNALKAFISILVCNFAGYFFYLIFLNAKNIEDPRSAAMGTAILSIVVFLFSVYIIFRIAIMEPYNSETIDERALLENAYKESNYTLNYNAYFIDQVKTRLWSYYFVAAITQIPLILNYFLARTVFGTVYEGPFSVYKFNMVSIWGYELFGDLWILGALVFVITFAVSFTALIYFEQKKWLVKPSYEK